MAKYEIKLMRRNFYGNNHVNLMNLHVDGVLFNSVVWRALVILKRENPDFHFEVYSEGQKITNGGDSIRIGEYER